MATYAIWEPAAGETEDDAQIFPAQYVEEAVEAWAESEDWYGAEYQIVGGQPATVMVRDLSSGAVLECVVTGEAVSYYTATKSSASIEADK